jgi:sugar (pentulose or hexulose) kinase
MEEGLVGIDFCGTTIKLGAYTREGEELYFMAKRNVPIVDKGGYWFDWKYQKKTIIEGLKEIVDRGIKILSIGPGTCGEAVYPIDEDGNILDNAIAWYCRRTEEQQKEFEEKTDPLEVFNICFLKTTHPTRPTPTNILSYSAHKINWYKKYKSEVYKRAACWLNVNGFINYFLTGKKYCDYTEAGTWLLYDTRKWEWSDRLCELNEIPKDVLPELINSLKVTGYVTEENKKYLGIDYDIPVIIGKHDGWSYTPEEDFKEYAYTYGGTFGGADIIDYMMAFFFNKSLDKLTDEDYERMQEEVDASPPGANGVRIYVDDTRFRPRKMRDLSGINILGIKVPLANNRGDVFRAVLEYLCMMNPSSGLISLERRGVGKDYFRKKMVIRGGLAKNRSYMMIMANMFNMPLYKIEGKEQNTLGVALLGGLGAGLYKDLGEVTNIIRPRYSKVYEPDPELVEEYRKIYDICARIPNFDGDSEVLPMRSKNKIIDIEELDKIVREKGIEWCYNNWSAWAVIPTMEPGKVRCPQVD